MAKNSEITVNFTEEELQQMLTELLESNGKTVHMFNWNIPTKDGEIIGSTISNAHSLGRY